MNEENEEVRSEGMRRLRGQGYTLQVVGDYFGISRERVRQILVQRYGTAAAMPTLTRAQLGRLLGCTESKLIILERRGIVHPTHTGYRYIYNRDEAEKATLEVNRPFPMLDVKRICEECGKEFPIRPYQIRPGSPARFCSPQCWGAFAGRNYGFKATGDRGDREEWGKRHRKWDWPKVYELRDKTGWGAVRIGRALNIPEPAVSRILRIRNETRRNDNAKDKLG